MECWGARGGGALGDGSHPNSSYGKGGYTYGIINLSDLSTLFIYCGQQGTDAKVGTAVAGGWNGGGKGGWDGNDDDACGAGGGATDIRITQASSTASTWYSFDSMKSRIMVAGGGGGGGVDWEWYYGYKRGGYGGYGGNTTAGKAYSLYNSSKTDYSGTEGSQTSGYKFGQGGDGKNAPFSNACSAGGGSGYWGGTTSTNTSTVGGNGEMGGHGGSSYISGYSGCVAVKSGTSDSDITFRSETNAVTKATHTSGLVFTDGSMSNGDSSMPNPEAATGTMTGNNGNGYARITIKPYGD